MTAYKKTRKEESNTKEYFYINTCTGNDFFHIAGTSSFSTGGSRCSGVCNEHEIDNFISRIKNKFSTKEIKL